MPTGSLHCIFWQTGSVIEQEYIKVVGARENNLRGLNVNILKRKLTVFTGVSGSGKSSLVFDTVAAESQRLINETYPGFVQVFMPSQARADVEELEGLTAAIIVGQEPLAPNARSTFGTATDITGSLRVLFSRAAQPRAGGPAAYSFNIPSASGKGALEVNGVKKVRSFERIGGMCPACEGLGRASEIDLSAVVDEDLSLEEGAILIPGMKVGTWTWKSYAASGFYPVNVPVRSFDEKQKELLYYGADKKVKVGDINVTYQGLVPRMKASMLAKDPESLQKHLREFVQRAVVFVDCPECEGTRLARHARQSYLAGKSIAEVSEMELGALAQWLAGIDAPGVAPLVEALSRAVSNAIEIGLGYLSLSRPTSTLSGGEAQRTRMVRHVGSALSDVTYVFDEPTSGLHPHDIDRMNHLLLRLRDKGNTVLVVEHKPETIAIADHVIDMGPGAGARGGEIVFTGDVAKLRSAPTLTGKHFADRVRLKEETRPVAGAIEIRSAARNNLREVDVDLPLGVLSVITGVAGSGKSSLLACIPSQARERMQFLTQEPIRGSRRSNPATYSGALEPIRKAFAKANGVKPALFSANSAGACPHCNGAGVVHVELGVMSGVDVPCEVCEGRRFSEDVLGYRFGGKNIAEVLELPAQQAAEFFRANSVPQAAKICAALVDVGLGYIALGQPLSTLSGGERQRLKLAVHLSDKKSTQDVLVLDEPTTGLHLADVETLLALLDRLADSGTTVICVDHHLGVVAHSDFVIDLGPGAGTAGGRLVAACTPRALLEVPESITGRYLADYLKR